MDPGRGLYGAPVIFDGLTCAGADARVFKEANSAHRSAKR